MIKNIIIGSGIAVIVVLGFISLKAPSVVTNTVYKDAPVGAVQSSPVVNVPAPVVNVAAPKVSVNVPEQKLGALSSPDLPYPYFSFGGARQYAGSLSLTQSSSTVCAIQSPVSTSTLAHGSIQFTLASTSAITLDLGRGTTQYATTTKIGSTYAISAGAQASIVASSTGSVAGDATIFPPSTWFLVIFNTKSGTTGIGNVPTGSCKAVFQEL